MTLVTRRELLSATPSLAAVPWLVNSETSAGPGEGADTSSPYREFPAQKPDRVREMVGASHGDIDRVRALLAESPALAKATWDWGFGDWETALGAASHTGQREIAQLLMQQGARPDIFTFAMLGMLAVVQEYVKASPGIQSIHGPHGLTLLHHARQGGKAAEAVVAYLEQAGNADLRARSLSLSDSEKQVFLGQYAFGPAQDDKLEVALTKAGGLTIRRGPEGTARGLVYLGSNEFHPVGAAAVRIRFPVGQDRSSELTVIDGPLRVRAARVPQ